MHKYIFGQGGSVRSSGCNFFFWEILNWCVTPKIASFSDFKIDSEVEILKV